MCVVSSVHTCHEDKSVRLKKKTTSVANQKAVAKKAVAKKAVAKKVVVKKKVLARKMTSSGMPGRQVSSKAALASRVQNWPGMLSSVIVPVDTSVYSLDVVLGAAYVLMGKAYVHLSALETGSVQVMLTGKTELDEQGLRALGGDFANELVNQILRVRLDESGRKLREYIVAKAHFFQQGSGQDVKKLLDATLQEAFDDDPLDIAVPWEEKYGGGKS